MAALWNYLQHQLLDGRKVSNVSVNTVFFFISESTQSNLICGLYKAVLTHDKLLMNLVPTRKVKVVL
jgi:hypothetical protein